MAKVSLESGWEESTLSTVKIVGAYLLFGILWILFSDQLLSSIVTENAELTRWQTLKGWAFFIVTAPMLFVLITRGKAARRRAVDALLRSEAKFRRVVESNMIGIIFWNPNGQITDANDAFLKIVGHTRQDLMEGKVNWRNMTPTEYRELDRRAGDESGEFGISTPFEKEYIRQDGSRVPVLIGLATLAEAEGLHIGFVLEMTERKRAEHALRTSERQLREILETIQLVSIIFDQKGEIVFCNDFLIKLTGWQREEVIGANWFETFVPADQRELIRFVFEEMFTNGKSPSHIEYEIQTRDGWRRTVSWSNTILRDAEGKGIGTTGIGADITELKRSEKQLFRSNEQLRALSARLQFVREEERIRIAREIHDVLGQALTALKLDVWWLVKRLQGSATNMERSVLLGKLEMMAQLINSTIPSVRKLASELRPGVLDDLGLVAAIEWQAKEFQARTGIVCTCSLSGENIDLGQDRSTAVFRIFQEILTNIARHAEASRVEIRMHELNGDLKLEVIDNGLGITDDVISGTGSLGLLGMRERALLFRGEVKIRRAREKGTIVIVTIPLRRRNVEKPGDAAYKTAASRLA